MKLFGGKMPHIMEIVKKKLTQWWDKLKNLSIKSRIIIGACLVVLAGIITVAAVFANSVEPPIPVTGEAEVETEDQVVLDGDAIDIEGKARKKDFFTILIVGTDKAGWNTDTIMLAAFDIAAGKVNILSIPRDTYVDVKRSNKKINSAFAISGKGNVDELMREVKAVTGIKPDKYALVALDGFIEIIDAIGGVTVDVPVNMVYSDPSQDLTINIKKGIQTLDGYDAMGFMRFRKTYAEGDIGRIKVQQRFIKALVNKMLTPSTLTKIPKLSKIVMDNVKTDLSLGNMVWLAQKAIELDPSTDIQTFMLPGEGGYHDKLSYYFLYKSQVLDMVNEHFNPYVSPIRNVNIVDPRGAKEAPASAETENVEDTKPQAPVEEMPTQQPTAPSTVPEETPKPELTPEPEPEVEPEPEPQPEEPEVEPEPQPEPEPEPEETEPVVEEDFYLDE